MLQDEADKIWSLIKSAKFAMLVTDDDGQLRGRPMVASQVGFDGALWFFTRASSHKVSEIAQDNRVCVTYAATDQQDYVSFSGTARLVLDPVQIERRWSEYLATWFPDGKNDPDLALLEVTVEQAEYWDATTSVFVRALGYVKAKVTGRPPVLGETRKVTA